MPDEIQIDDLSPEVLEEMTDLTPMWEAICRDLGVNPKLVRVHFLERFEWKWDPDYSWVGWGVAAARFPDDDLPEVAMVLLYSKGKNGYYLDMMDLRETCYHELIHLLLPEEIEEEVAWMAGLLNLRQEGWQYWRFFLQDRALARGLGFCQNNSYGVLTILTPPLDIRKGSNGLHF